MPSINSKSLNPKRGYVQFIYILDSIVVLQYYFTPLSVQSQ